MGKKVTMVSQASIKICKSTDKSNKQSRHHHHEQLQLDSLIQILRPKVYITDTSNFKTLVQELTGNGNGNNNHGANTSCVVIPSSSSSSSPDQHHQNQPIETINGNKEQALWQSSSDMDSEVRELLNNYDQIINVAEAPLKSSRASNKNDKHAQQEQVDLLALEELESWLLDVEMTLPNFSGNYIAQDHGVIGLFDNEFPGMMF